MKYISLLEFVLDFADFRDSVCIYDCVKDPGKQLAYNGSIESLIKDMTFDRTLLFAPISDVSVMNGTLALTVDPSNNVISNEPTDEGITTLRGAIDVLSDQKVFNIYIDTGHVLGERSPVLTALAQNTPLALRDITPVYTGLKSNFLEDESINWMLDRPVFYIALTKSVADLRIPSILIG